MKKINTLLIIFILLFTNLVKAEISISVFIDDEIITNYDIEKEISYLQLLNTNLEKLEKKQKFSIAKNLLIKEVIKSNEVKKHSNIDINETDLDNYLKNFIAKLGLKNKQEFKKILILNTNYGIEDIEKKIKIEMLWNELIYKRYYSQVKINKKRINDKLKELKDNTIKEYFLSEIIFEKKRDIPIESLHNEIKISIKEIGFNNTANIYSIADSSNFGGKIGWINAVTLPEEIRENLDHLNIGDHTKIIRFGNNYSIFKIEDLKLIKNKINTEEETKKLINEETNKQLLNFSQIYFNKIKLNYKINETQTNNSFSW